MLFNNTTSSIFFASMAMITTIIVIPLKKERERGSNLISSMAKFHDVARD